MTTAQTNDNPSVYVSTYAKYNNGNLKGAWIDLTNFNDYDDFLAHCRDLHSDEQDPELMFQDYENFPHCYYAESGLDSSLWEYINLDDDDREMLEAYHEAGFEGNIDDARDAFQGHYESDYEFACEMLEMTGDIQLIPEYLSNYFDYDKFARDLMFDYSSSNGFYFSNN